MGSVIGAECFAASGPKKALARSAKAAVLGTGAVVVALLFTSAAQAQCTAPGFVPPPGFPTGPAVTAVAGVSAYVGTLAASIHAANTAFLSQSTAFVASPPNPQPDQQAGGVWARGVGGHL